MFSSSIISTDNYNTFKSFLNPARQTTIKRELPQSCPEGYKPIETKHDELHKGSSLKCDIQNTLNTPGYAYMGLKGDPDFNFFEYMQVCKIPYYIGGLGLIAVALAGRNNNNPAAVIGNKALTKKIACGVIFYYIAKELAKKVIDIPVKLFRGVDLNMKYRNITDIRESNPMNLPNLQKSCYEPIFSSSEFTRYDLLYNNKKPEDRNKFFADLAKKFGAKGELNDADSAVMGKIKKLIIMSDSWKYLLSAPLVTLALGLAQEDALSDINLKQVCKNSIDLVKDRSKISWGQFKNTINGNLFAPIGNAFADFWRGYSIPFILKDDKNAIQHIANNTSVFKKSIGKFVIISSLVLPIVANLMILNKTSLKNESNKNQSGGNN